jgi:poly(beta-D-mannuronate) lyase
VMRDEKNQVECFRRQLDDWAQRGGLSVATSVPAHIQRQWALAGIAASMMKVKSHGIELNPPARAWLHNLMNQVKSFHDEHNLINNHAAWAAFAVGAAAHLLGDQNAWTWAKEREMRVLEQVTDTGLMPPELRRGPRASTYHAFAATPLIAFERLRACRNDTDPRATRALDRVLKLLRQIEATPQLLEPLANSPQFPIATFPKLYSLQVGQGASAFDPMLGGDTLMLHNALSRCMQ